MATSVKLKVALAAALAIPTGYVAWQVANPPPPPLHVADGLPAGAAVASQATAEGPPSGARVDAAPLAAMVRCQLTGVLPGVPWTSPIQVDVAHAAGTTTVSLTPAADGSFAVALPDQAVARALTCRGDDRHYAPLAHELTVDVVRAALAGGTACPIAVTPIAVCTGVVVDADGAAIAAARVAAAEWVEGKSAGAAIEANTDATGAFVLRFPRPADVVVVAVAMNEMVRSFRRTGADGAIPDTGAPRPDLLPAATAARVRFGQWADLGRLVLEAPAWVRGRIVDPAGRPIADETVHWTPLRQSIVFRAGGLELRGETWERLALATTASTDAEGRFCVPARAGTTGTLAFASAELLYEPFVASRRATAPADVTIELAGATAVLRVVRGDQPVPGVAVAYQGYRGGRWPVTDGNGNVRLLREQALPQQVTLRAPGLPFLPVTLPRDTRPDQPIVIDLAQLHAAPIVFSVTSRVPVHQVVATFARDGVPVGDSVAMQRDAATGELRCEFVPGAYQVAIHPAGGDGNDSYLLPAEISIEVPADGARVPLPLRHGGRIRVLLRDERGADIAGTLRFLAPDGGDHEVFLEVTGGLVFDGAVPGNGPALTNTLEPGTWEVIADLGVRGVHRRRVEVSPCDITEVAVVVP